MQCSDAKATLEIALIHLLESLEYLGNRPVRKMVDRRKTNFLAQRQKERDLIHKENVSC
jgi:hypothetical protein